MRLKFKLDPQGTGFICNFVLSKRYSGPPGHCHGGIIATILDDAMSKLNRLRSVVAATAKLQIDYLKPVPLGTRLRVVSREITKRGRTLIRTAEIVNQQGTVLARGRGVFIVINPGHAFSRK